MHIFFLDYCILVYLIFYIVHVIQCHDCCSFNKRFIYLSIYLNIDGVICPMVVDTGANVTVVLPDELSGSTLSRLQGTMRVLKTATGDTENVAGKLWLGIKIGGTEFSHETLVADISDKFILDLDFLMVHGCTVDAGAGSLHIGVEEVPLHKPSARQLSHCYRLTAVEDTDFSSQ